MGLDSADELDEAIHDLFELIILKLAESGPQSPRRKGADLQNLYP